MRDTPQNILIRFPNWVGDVVMAMPALEAVRVAYPQARIRVMVRSYAAGILSDCPWVDEVIGCRDEGWLGPWRAARRLAGKPKADLGILLPNSTRAYLSLRLAGVRRIHGYRRGLHGPCLHSSCLPVREGGDFVPMPMVRIYLDLVASLGIPVPDTPCPRLFIGEELAARGEAYLADLGIGEDEAVVGLNPGAKFGGSKCWPPGHFARLAERLHDERGVRVLLLVGPGEESLADAIEGEARCPLVNTARHMADLALLKPVIRRCRLLVTNDTGPRHYAVALGVPVVVLMGPTDPRWTAANLERTLVLREDVDCSPCHRKTCPTDHRCMVRLTPERVFEAATTLLEDG